MALDCPEGGGKGRANIRGCLEGTKGCLRPSLSFVYAVAFLSHYPLAPSLNIYYYEETDLSPSFQKLQHHRNSSPCVQFVEFVQTG